MAPVLERASLGLLAGLLVGPLMAISKKVKRLGGPSIPEAAAFVRVIDEGMADPEVVSHAYQQAMRDWRRAGGRVELRPDDVTQDRAEALTGADREAPEARLILLGRTFTFNRPKGGK